jgi:hypothetical protein
MNKNILFLNPVPLIYDGIMYGFKQNGWNTYLVSPEDKRFGYSKEIQVEMINSYIEKYNINFVFCEMRCGCEWQAIFNLCNLKNIKFIIWGIEDIPSYTNFLDSTIDYCHYYYTTTEELITYVKNKYNKDIKIIRFGVNPEIHKAFDKVESYTNDLVFCGNNYNARSNDFQEFIMPLVVNNYDIAVYGNEWWLDESYNVNLCRYQHLYKGYCSWGNTSLLYSSCKIILGMNNNRFSKTQVSMRPCEAMGVGAGAIFISPWSPAQEYWYGKSGEYAFFPKSQNEMIENVNYVLNMTEEERLQMSKKAQEMIYQNHNYTDIVKVIINDLNSD